MIYIKFVNLTYLCLAAFLAGLITAMIHLNPDVKTTHETDGRISTEQSK